MPDLFVSVQWKLCVLSSETNISNFFFAQSAEASSGFPYFSQSPKFLQRFSF